MKESEIVQRVMKKLAITPRELTITIPPDMVEKILKISRWLEEMHGTPQNLEELSLGMLEDRIKQFRDDVEGL